LFADCALSIYCVTLAPQEKAYKRRSQTRAR
jgi:hypothetical protein